MSHTATLSHKQALAKLIGHFLFMRQSRSVRHAQLRGTTLLHNKVAWQNHRCEIGLSPHGMRSTDVAYCDRCRMVCLSVGHMGEPGQNSWTINMPFLRLTHVGQRNHVLDGGQGQTNPFAWEIDANTTMQPFVKILWPLVSNCSKLTILTSTGFRLRTTKFSALIIMNRMNLWHRIFSISSACHVEQDSC